MPDFCPACGAGNGRISAITQGPSHHEHQFKAANGFCFDDRNCLSRCLYKQISLLFNAAFRIGNRLVDLRELVEPVCHFSK